MTAADRPASDEPAQDTRARARSSTLVLDPGVAETLSSNPRMTIVPPDAAARSPRRPAGRARAAGAPAAGAGGGRGAGGAGGRGWGRICASETGMIGRYYTPVPRDAPARNPSSSRAVPPSVRRQAIVTTFCRAVESWQTLRRLWLTAFQQPL